MHFATCVSAFYLILSVFAMFTGACKVEMHPTVFNSQLVEGANKLVKILVNIHQNRDNSYLATILLGNVSKFYPDNNVFVMVYDPISGLENHAHWACQSLHYYRAEKKKNVIIAIGSKTGSNLFSLKAAEDTLSHPRYGKTFQTTAEDLLRMLSRETRRQHCKSVFLTAAIYNEGEAGVRVAATENSYAMKRQKFSAIFQFAVTRHQILCLFG